jgi:hypothetical protein
MSNISANTVFHFTNSFKALVGILVDHAFRVNYCREEFRLNKKLFRYLIPMVSFCDIPLSAAEEHMQSYGTYGIGLTKTWARRQGLNPVLYVNRASKVGGSIYYEFDRIGRRTSPDVGESRFRDIFRYVKNDIGPHPKQPTKRYVFQNEREWRYAPDYELDTDGGINILKGKTDDQINSLKSRLNNTNAGLMLSFKLSDIKYIILRNGSEIEYLSGLTVGAFAHFTDKDRLKLVRSILTYSQIRLDF